MTTEQNISRMDEMAEKDKASAITKGALAGAGVIGTYKLIETLTRKAEAAPGEAILVTLDPETLQLLIAMAQGITQANEGVAACTAGVNTLLAAAGEPPVIGGIEQIPFSHTLTPGETLTLREYAPFAGYITFVSIHWPSGCAATVDVAVVHGLTQFCPREGYLALDDATPIYEFGKRIHVDDHEEIRVKLRNRGGADHTITVVVMVEEG